MKVLQVNGKAYAVEVTGNRAVVNGRQVDLKVEEREGENGDTGSGGDIRSITIDGKQFFLDFYEEGEPSLMIISGVAYLVSKSSEDEWMVREVRAPISGQIADVAVAAGSEVARGQTLVVLEAMKMENQIKAPARGKVREVRVTKGQLVKSGDVLVTFE
ncbi:MAG: acetyl-CoA carboxylase biotin carboxyl carrier protein subunit [Thermoproteota archaeon]